MSHTNYGSCLLKLRRFKEAEKELLLGYAGLKTALGGRHERTQKALAQLIELYDTWGKPDKAASYKAQEGK